MRRNSLRKSTVSPLTQKIKAPQHLSRLKDEEDEFNNEWSDRFRLPSLPRRKSWKDNDNVLSNGNSAATSVSWSQEGENVATQKLEEQWAIVETAFYEEDDLLIRGSVLDECTQWRTQIPYLRLVGRNPTCADNNSAAAQRDTGFADKKMKIFDESQNDDLYMDHNLSMKEGDHSTPHKLNKAKFEDVIDMLMEHVMFQLSSNEENETDSLCESLNDALKIAPAPVHNNRNSSRNSIKLDWTEEAISPNYIENKSLSIRNRLLDTENSLQTVKNGANSQGVQKRRKSSVSTNKPRNLDTGDNVSKIKERLDTPHIGRNKLGTVFNEKIVVSPVPFAVTTRESFSTLKTIPIRFMSENMDISSFQGSAKNISGFPENSAKNFVALRNASIHSAWQAPVCPTVWPKNVRLAPIDTSRLPSSKNRSLAPSPAALHCSRKPLSPISRSAAPKSAYVTRERHNDLLQIEGKHIVPAQSKINMLSAGWDCNSRTTKSRKKIRAKERI